MSFTIPCWTIFVLNTFIATTFVSISHQNVMPKSPFSLFEEKVCSRFGNGDKELKQKCFNNFNNTNKYYYTALADHFHYLLSEHIEGQKRTYDMLGVVMDKFKAAIEELKAKEKDIPQTPIFLPAMWAQNDDQRDPNIKVLPGKNRKLKQSYSRSDMKIFPTRDACLQYCFDVILSPNNEVCQISYGMSSLNGFECRTSTARAKYVRTFPNRYLESNVDNPFTFYELYYDGMADDFPAKTPMLFYALDNVSQNTNLGNLGFWKYSLDMGQSAPHYDCDVGSSKVKALRLVPTDNYLIEIPHASFLLKSSFTLIFWIKITNSQTQSTPFIEVTSSGRKMLNWILSGNATGNNFNAFFTSNGNAPQEYKFPGINKEQWNKIYLHFNGADFQVLINNKSVFRDRFRQHVSLLGDRICIGRRDAISNWLGSMDALFDGCIAHLMMFAHSATYHDIHPFSDIILDPEF